MIVRLNYKEIKPHFKFTTEVIVFTLIQTSIKVQRQITGSPLWSLERTTQNAAKKVVWYKVLELFLVEISVYLYISYWDIKPSFLYGELKGYLNFGSFIVPGKLLPKDILVKIRFLILSLILAWTTGSMYLKSTFCVKFSNFIFTLTIVFCSKYTHSFAQWWLSIQSWENIKDINKLTSLSLYFFPSTETNFSNELEASDHCLCED